MQSDQAKSRSMCSFRQRLEEENGVIEDSGERGEKMVPDGDSQLTKDLGSQDP